MKIVATDRELIRSAFRPDSVKLLLVCDAPPANGRFFFDESFMTTVTRRVFEHITQVAFEDNNDFLNCFKRYGCYLDDLCHERIDLLTQKQRNKMLWDSVPAFSDRLALTKPGAIATLTGAIDPQVKHALKLTGLETQVHTLPFPGNGQQFRYMEDLSSLLERYVLNTSLPGAGASHNVSPHPADDEIESIHY